MTCGDLIPYVDGELPPDRADAFRAHLSTCKSCPHDLLLHVEIGARLSTIALQPQWSVESGLRNLGSGLEPPTGWERRVLEKLPHESWWIRAWRWLWQ